MGVSWLNRGFSPPVNGVSLGLMSRVGLLLLLASFVGVRPLTAMFLFEETKLVPIDRLIRNAERKLAADPKDGVAEYQLARLYSMRGVMLTNDVPVGITTSEVRFQIPGFDTGIPEAARALSNQVVQARAIADFTNSISHYEKAVRLLAKSTNAADRWLILPTHLGFGWTLQQAGRREDAIRQYRRTLKLAWDTEVGPSYQWRDWWDAIQTSVRNRRWVGLRPRGLGPGICFSEETIRYLKPLLDPLADAREITDLQKKQKHLSGMMRAITPLVVPTSSQHTLEALVDPGAGVPFDLDGSGVRQRWGWIRKDAAWLVWDPQGTGRIESGLQLFGAVTFWIFWRDGYEALTALDDNDDGELSGAELAGLALWSDRDGNGVSDSGEVVPVVSAGVVGLRCRPLQRPDGVLWHSEGALSRDGESRPTFDWMAPLVGDSVR